MQGLTVAYPVLRNISLYADALLLTYRTNFGCDENCCIGGSRYPLMLPEHADNRVTHLGSCSYLADVLRAGVKVYFYKKGFLHSKLMVSDDMLSTVGSTNLDFRSFEHKFQSKCLYVRYGDSIADAGDFLAG